MDKVQVELRDKLANKYVEEMAKFSGKESASWARDRL